MNWVDEYACSENWRSFNWISASLNWGFRWAGQLPSYLHFKTMVCPRSPCLMAESKHLLRAWEVTLIVKGPATGSCQTALRKIFSLDVLPTLCGNCAGITDPAYGGEKLCYQFHKGEKEVVGRLCTGFTQGRYQTGIALRWKKGDWKFNKVRCYVRAVRKPNFWIGWKPNNIYQSIITWRNANNLAHNSNTW